MRKSAPVGPNSWWPRLPGPHALPRGGSTYQKHLHPPLSSSLPCRPALSRPRCAAYSPPLAGTPPTYFPERWLAPPCLCCPPPARPPPAAAPWAPIGKAAATAWSLLALALLIGSGSSKLCCGAMHASRALHRASSCGRPGCRGVLRPQGLSLGSLPANAGNRRGGWTPWVAGWSASLPGPPLTAPHDRHSRRTAPLCVLLLTQTCSCPRLAGAPANFAPAAVLGPRALGRCQRSDAVLLHCT